MRVINVAVTQGSKKERQAGRAATSCTNACDYLGFDLVHDRPERPREDQSEDPRSRTRSTGPPASRSSRRILAEHQPTVVFFPHDTDWNSTHIGTHHLRGGRARRSMPAGFTCHVVETEFWGAMADPNLMVESSVDDLADMMAALSFHVGEVQRNPYHLLVPAWMQDNVRRGGEVVGGQGGAAPDFMLLRRSTACASGRTAGSARSTRAGARSPPARARRGCSREDAECDIGAGLKSCSTSCGARCRAGRGASAGRRRLPPWRERRFCAGIA